MRFFLFVELFHQSHFKRAEKILNTALSNQFESRRHQTAIPPTTLPAAFQARMPTRLTPHYGQPGNQFESRRHQTTIPPTALLAAFQTRMPTRLTPHYGQPGI